MLKRYSQFIFSGLLLCLTISVSFAKTFEPPSNLPCPVISETALSSGMVITALTPNGRVRITAEDNLVRTFEWGESCSKTHRMTTRPIRWWGSCGIYSEDFSVSSGLFTCEGLSRVVAEDAIMDFETLDEAQEYLNKHYGGAFTYRNDGLAVAHYTTPDRHQLNVDVIQVLIKGQKPTSLPSSQDEKITISTSTKPSWQRYGSNGILWLRHPIVLFGLFLVIFYYARKFFIRIRNYKKIE